MTLQKVLDETKVEKIQIETKINREKHVISEEAEHAEH